MDNASQKHVSHTRPDLALSTDKTQYTLFVTNRPIIANDTKSHTHRSHESPSSFPYRYHRPFRSAFAPHAHARTLPAHVMYAALSASSSLGAQRVGDMSSRNGTSSFVCFFLIECVVRASATRSPTGNDGRRVIFRDAWRARGRRRRGFAPRMGPRGTRTTTIRVTNGCVVMRVVYRRCVVGAVIVAYRFGEGRCRRRWRVEGFRS